MKNLIFTSSLMLAAAATIPAHADDSIHSEKLQEVVVKGVRAQKNAPFAVANIKKKELENFSKSGKELPFLFANTPGVLAWSENGVGTGTTYMRVRGAAGSRINITLDGVPLNSPEDQTVFWANMNSYASLLKSVQIQRGIGTSTNGDGAFGGSISLLTKTPSREKSLELTGSYGSYNTYNIGASFSSGLLWKHLIFDGAYHETSTDGYMHGTDGRSGSYYGGLTWLGKDFTLRYKNIGNFEKTGQAWNGATAGNDDATLMAQGIKTYKDMYKHGLGKFNSLYEGLVFDSNSWTFPQDSKGNFQTYRYKLDNGKYWDRTTDNFYQNHNILSGSWMPSEHWSHDLALHYTYGYGYYSEFKPQAKFSKFGLTATDAEGNKIKRADFVRKKGLTQNQYGAVYNANYKNEKWDVIGGFNISQFRCNHFGKLKYVSNVGQTQDFTGLKYYDSDARKDDYSVYAKATYHIFDFLDAYGDMQYRHVFYKTNGMNDKYYSKDYSIQTLDIHKNYDFWNPKAGLSFHKNGHNAYFSVAYAGREPERNNFTDNGSYPAPKAEHMIDYEFGYNYDGSNWHAGVNFYHMNYKNQFVQTGQQSDIGENLTTNIDKSYRQGIEFSADWSPLSWFTVAGNAALSQNKIKDFTEYVDNWDGDAVTRHYNKSTLSFSPSVILNGFLNFHYSGFEATWHTNFVGRQYLDNTGNKDRSLPCYSQSNLNLSYGFNPKGVSLGIKQIVLGVDFNNIFNRHYASSGWVYSAVSKESGYDLDHRYYQIGFIPMAGFTAMGNITLKF